MKLKSTLLVLSIFITQILIAQVGIGTTTPNAALDITSNDNGLLIPRIGLTSTLDNTTVVTLSESELVYNTSTVSDVTPGFYYWDGSKWVKVLTQFNNNAWTTIGNSGTNPSTNFLGTTDANDFVIKTDDSERMRVLSNGHVLVNTNSNDATIGANNIFEVQTTASNEDAITGIATLGTAYGVHGISSNSGAGIFGTNNGDGSGVYGFNDSNGAGVRAQNSSTGNAIFSRNYGTGLGIYSYAELGNSLYGYTPSTYDGVAGINANTGSGIAGYNWNSNANSYGNGVYGTISSTTTTGNGVFGYINSPNAVAVRAYNPGGGHGVFGETDGTRTGWTGGVTGYIIKPSAGHQDSAAVIGFTSTGRQGTGGYAGPTFVSTNSAQSAVAGNIASRETNANTDAYLFGVIGDVGFDVDVTNSKIADRTGGVLGFNGMNAWGVVGYKNSAGTQYSLYGAGNSSIAAGNTGRGLSTNSNEANNTIGIGIHGGFWGGYINGSQYGLLAKGEKYGLYVQGNTIVDKPIVQVDKVNNTKVFTYATTSKTVDVTTRGRAELKNGVSFIKFDSEFINQISDNLENITINVTPMGPTKGVYVTNISKDGFYVNENLDGKSNVLINWTAISIKKGYENGVEISTELKSADFDKKIENVMYNDGNTKGEASPIYFDGKDVKFERIPEHLLSPKGVDSQRKNKTIIPGKVKEVNNESNHEDSTK